MLHIDGAMRVYLDGQQLNIPQPTLAAAIAEAAERSRVAGRSIVDILADGQRVQSDALDVAKVQELRFITANPGEQVKDACSKAAAALTELAERQQDLAAMIQSGKTQDAFEHLRSILETWQAVRDVADQCGQLLGVDLGQVALPGIDAPRPLEQCAAGLSAALTQVKTGLANEDWSLLSDTIGYDLDALAGNWRVVLEAIGNAAPTLRKGGGPP